MPYVILNICQHIHPLIFLDTGWIVLVIFTCGTHWHHSDEPSLSVIIEPCPLMPMLRSASSVWASNSEMLRYKLEDLHTIGKPTPSGGTAQMEAIHFTGHRCIDLHLITHLYIAFVLRYPLFFIRYKGVPRDLYNVHTSAVVASQASIQGLYCKPDATVGVAAALKNMHAQKG